MMTTLVAVKNKIKHDANRIAIKTAAHNNSNYNNTTNSKHICYHGF